MKKFFLLGIVAVLGMAFLTGCTQYSGQASQPTIIKVGVIAPVSGPAANYGEDAINAYTMVVDTFNASHKTTQIQLIIEDDHALAKDATSAAQKLISVDKVSAIVGPLFSAPAMPAGALAQQNKTVLLTPTASAASISSLGEYIYRFWNDEFATQKVGNYLNDHGAKHVVYIGENTDSGIDYLKGIKRYFSGSVADIIYQIDEKDFAMVAKKIKAIAGNADYLVMFPVNDSSANSLVKSMKKEGLLDTFKNKIFSNEISINDSAIKQLGSDIEGFKTATFALTLDTPPAGESFIEQFKQTYEIKGAPYLLLLEAEGMSLIVDTLASQLANSDELRAQLDKINAKHPREGLFGSYYFDSNGDAIGLDFVIQEVKDGKVVAIK